MPSFRLRVSPRITILFVTMHLAWAEDRALLGSNPSAVPGAKIGDRGDNLSSHSFVLSEIGTNAINPTFIPYSFFPLVYAPRLSSGSREFAALRIRFPLAKHMPYYCCQLSHDGDPGDFCSSSTFDAFEPLPQPSVLAQYLLSHLRQQPPGHTATSFCDIAQALIVFTTVATAWCQTPIVG